MANEIKKKSTGQEVVVNPSVPEPQAPTYAQALSHVRFTTLDNGDVVAGGVPYILDPFDKDRVPEARHVLRGLPHEEQAMTELKEEATVICQERAAVPAEPVEPMYMWEFKTEKEWNAARNQYKADKVAREQQIADLDRREKSLIKRAVHLACCSHIYPSLIPVDLAESLSDLDEFEFYEKQEVIIKAMFAAAHSHEVVLANIAVDDLEGMADLTVEQYRLDERNVGFGIRTNKFYLGDAEVPVAVIDGYIRHALTKLAVIEDRHRDNRPMPVTIRLVAEVRAVISSRFMFDEDASQPDALGPVIEGQATRVESPRAIAASVISPAFGDEFEFASGEFLPNTEIRRICDPDWCRRNGIANDKDLFIALVKWGGSAIRFGKPRINGERTRGYYGLRLVQK